MNYVEEIRQAIIAKTAELCPEWKIEETPSLVDSYALLVLTVGPGVTRAMVHNAWSIWSNTIGPEHRYLIPFVDLPRKIQAQDEVGVEIITEVAIEVKGRHIGEMMERMKRVRDEEIER